MPKTHMIIDTLNLFFRSIHTINPAMGIDVKSGMALHTIMNSVRKAWRMFDCDHAVFAHEGKSWRKTFYPKYKLNRKLAQVSMSQKEKEDQAVLLEALNDLVGFLQNDTNTTNIVCPVAEADDMIAIWVQTHPEDNHVIVSSDSDFVQLLKHKNVTIYNGVTDVILTHEGVFDDKMRKLEFSVKSDGKLKIGKPNPNFVADPDWFEYAIFLKKIRGDKSDNIFSAYPGARLKGSKTKVGIDDAFADRHNRGFTWNNFMLQRWRDEDEVEHLVKDVFDRNCTLIDLELQPEEIRKQCIEVISTQDNAENVDAVGIKFMKFCGRWDLKKLSDSAHDFAKILNSRI